MNHRAAVLATLFLLTALSAAASDWPELSKLPSGAAGGGQKDAAVVIALENYAAVAPVPGALLNANDWHAHLTGALKVPLERVSLLRDNEATRETIEEKIREAAAAVEPGGTLWFVFIGHGAPSKDGKDGLLVGWDAQQRADSLFARSVPQKAVLAAMAKGRQARAVLVVDACFSGRTPEGAPLVPGLQPLILKAETAAASLAASRAVVLTAARSDQFAGPLPGASRPAFSYLTLGALRGWASEGKDAVSPEGVIAYVGKALRALQVRQQPELSSFATGQSFPSAHESGPDIASLVRAAPAAGAAASVSPFQFSALAALPRPRAPGKLDVPSAGLDMAGVDVDALAKYDAALKLDKGDAAPEAKAAGWRTLAKEAPAYAALAEKRAKQWDAFAAQQDAVETAREKRLPARDADWAKLGKLLGLEVVAQADKRRWSGQFVAAYLDSPGLDAEMAEKLSPHLTPQQAKALAGRSFAKAERLWTHSADGDGFTLTLPESWKLAGGSADEESAYRIFKDANRPGWLIVVHRYRHYTNRKNNAGTLFLVSGASEYASQLAGDYWSKLEGTPQRGTMEAGGRTFITVSRKVMPKEGAYCKFNIDELCTPGVQQFALIDGTNIPVNNVLVGDAQVLGVITPLDGPPMPAAEWRSLVRGFKPR